MKGCLSPLSPKHERKRTRNPGSSRDQLKLHETAQRDRETEEKGKKKGKVWGREEKEGKRTSIKILGPHELANAFYHTFKEA